MTGLARDRPDLTGVVEGVTVVRVAPTGFTAPIPLCAVRIGGRLRCARVDPPSVAVPEIGAVVTVRGADEDGWVVVPVGG